MQPLYKLSEQWEQLSQMMESGEITPEEMADTLDALEGEINNKIENCLAVHQRLEQEADALADEIKRLQQRMKKRSDRMNWLKAYVLCGNAKSRHQQGRGRAIQHHPQGRIAQGGYPQHGRSDQ